ncbi:hypothetical protein BGZ90_004475, partial [Linnemannia elongata]
MYRSAGFTEYAGVCGLVSRQGDPTGSGRIDQIADGRVAVVRGCGGFLKNHNPYLLPTCKIGLFFTEADPAAGEFAAAGYQGFHPGYQPTAPTET